MKLHPEDPRLSAYVLGELDAEDAAAVESAAAADPALQQVIDETAAMQGLLTKRLGVSGAGLLPEQRENVRRSARTGGASESNTRFPAFSNILKFLIIPAAAVVVLVACIAALLQMSDDGDSPVVKKPRNPAPLLPVEPPPVKLTPPWSPHRTSVKVTDFPTLQLPVEVGSGNLELIRKSIQDDEKLPAIRDVRLEEILNSFQLRMGGMTAIARRPAAGWHPDSREGEVTSPVATLSAETVACPWKPSAVLLLISLRGNARNDCTAKLEFHPNPATVFRYRLLGSYSEAGSAIPELTNRLPAKAATTLAIEIEPSGADRAFGSLEWFANDVKAPSISLVRNDDAEPSDDARFAALVCTYAQWLAGEQVGVIDAEIVAALAREVASGKLEADRAEFLSMIDKSLHL